MGLMSKVGVYVLRLALSRRQSNRKVLVVLFVLESFATEFLAVLVSS